MNSTRIRTLCCTVAASMLIAGMAGCARDDAASFLASGKSYVEKSDYKAAIIEIKNALQREPNNGEARYLLAKSLLATGDPAGAETEARKAIALHYSDDAIYPLLALAMIGQGEFQNVTRELATMKLGTAEGRADLGVTLAGAYLGQGDQAKARSALDAALADQPGNVRALLLQARIAGQSGNLAAARGYVEAALKSAPDDVDALLLKAEIALGEGKRDDAQKLFEHAIDKHPDSLAARFALTSLAATTGQLDLAKVQLDKMKELSPREFRTVYADALVAFSSGDNARARDAIQRVLAGKPNHLPALLLLGLVNFRLGSYAAAEDSLRKVLSRIPNDPNASRALAAVYMRTGRVPLALETLGPALRRAPDDPVLLRTAGEAYLASGKIAEATSSYERANAIDKSNIGSQVRLAQVRLAAGDTQRAFSDLEALTQDDSAKVQAELALFAAHLRRREYDQALAAADAVEKKQPKSALPANLRGIVYLSKRDLKDARASFDKALEIQPDFYSPAYNLAVIDIQEGQPQAARERYERMLAKTPKNEQLLLAYAEVLTIAGGTPDQVKAALDKAVAANPTSTRARLALIGYSARQPDRKATVALAQTALVAIPGDPQLTEALAASEIAAGDMNQAIETYKRLVQLQPNNPLPLLRLAEAQMGAKDYAGAIDSERKALAAKPDFVQAYASLAKTYLLSGKPDAAVAEARKLQKEQPDKAVGYALEGEIFAAQKKWPESALAFRESLVRQAQPLLAARFYVALQAAGKNSDATAMAAKWVKEHPDDATVPLMLAQQSQQRKDASAAIAGYQKVLDIDPDNVVALNNLAWMMTEQKNAKGLEYAERAHRLAPMNPGVLDTLGWTLTHNGEAKRGAQLLRMASTLAPKQSEIRLHLAQALAQSGDKTGARKEIDALTKLDKQSPIRIEAEKLQATL